MNKSNWEKPVLVTLTSFIEAGTNSALPESYATTDGFGTVIVKFGTQSGS